MQLRSGSLFATTFTPMNNELTNLLPLERQASLGREYKLRVGTVAALLVTLLALISAALRIPTYVFVTQAITSKEARLSSVEAALAASDSAAITARLSALTSDEAMLTTLSKLPTASGVLRTILAVSRSGVSLSSLGYTSAAGSKPGAITLSGKASTRDTLRAYQVALQGVSGVKSASVPVSAFAGDADIPFVMTLNLTPLP